MAENGTKLKSHVAAKLSEAGVKCISVSHFRLKCEKCGADWSPNVQSGGRLPRDYWVCPNGCNK